MVKAELHLHPNLKAYGPGSIAKAMKSKGIGLAALVGLNEDVFPLAQKKASKQRKYQHESDDIALVVKDKNSLEYYLLRAVEIETKERYHLLIIGDGRIKPHMEAAATIDEALEKECLVIFAHPLVDMQSLRLGNLRYTKIPDLLRTVQSYPEHVALEWNGYCKPWVRRLLGGRDVNKRIKGLALAHNIPLVAATDVHANSELLLNAIGTANIETEIETDSGRSIIDSLRANIFSGKYTNNESYVSFQHFYEAFFLPYLFNTVLEKLRGLYESKLPQMHKVQR